jgi:hypothetical protein
MGFLRPDLLWWTWQERLIPSLRSRFPFSGSSFTTQTYPPILSPREPSVLAVKGRSATCAVMFRARFAAAGWIQLVARWEKLTVVLARYKPQGSLVHV